MTKRSPSGYFHTSPEIVGWALMIHVRFPLSLANIEDLLHGFLQDWRWLMFGERMLFEP